jgi:predicted RNase H-like HicB family nuclease
MSGKSKKSAKAIDRPFAADVLAKARKVVDEYQVIVHREEGRWYGRGLEMPLVFGDGATVEACVKDTREALLGAVAYLLEENERPPAPATAGQRTEQVNVRLTAEEKLLLEASAKRKGFSGLSDFIRAAAVEATR